MSLSRPAVSADRLFSDSSIYFNRYPSAHELEFCVESFLELLFQLFSEVRVSYVDQLSCSVLKVCTLELSDTVFSNYIVSVAS